MDVDDICEIQGCHGFHIKFMSKRNKSETDLQKHVTVSSTSMESDVSMAEYLRTFLLPRPNIGTRARRYQGNVGRCVGGIKQRRERKGEVDRR
ncbi:hypothetical protein EAG_03373 [Camponotus floridanus]|uniref:Uncharacterized protein n=1 Tax=Camponotus floridanus TaxID=104421 RepID=E2AAL0_CAMFO|nr:hypothetical protein EAG_03373 [Camponotus floridanus]